MKSFVKIVFLFLCCFAFLFFVAPMVIAQGETPPPIPCPDLGPAPSCGSPTSPVRCDNSPVYRCANNECKKDGGSIQKGTQYYQCVTSFFPTTTTDSNNCAAWTCGSSTNHSSGPFYDHINSYSTPGDYQICPASGNGWSSSTPAYQCSGSCYPKPEIKTLGDSSLSPKNVFENPATVKLPVNIGISDSFSPASVQTEFTNESCAVDSYHYEILGGPASVAGNTPQTKPQAFIGSCALQPNVTSYSATAQACFEGNCGQKSDPLAFSTSNAPELKTPNDPDWEQNTKNAPAKIPVILEWCPAPGANFFHYQIYKEKPLDTFKVWEDIVPSSTTHYSDAGEDNSVNILQKGALYLWKVASCSAEDPTKCGIPSQVWSFTPSYTTLKTPELKTPKNGDTVNLQSVFAWNGDNFAHHYLVRMNGPIKDSSESFVEFSPEESQLPLNSLWDGKTVFDRLLFNTSYQWQVKSCAKTECEADWSKTWQFKTTGAQPTGLATKPIESGQTAIPATLDWDDMPGAASYAFEVAGATGLATEKSEAVVDYPSIKTATSYSWRVKTCADKLGKVCGDWSTNNFTTVTLAKPPITFPDPAQKEFDSPTKISWGKVFGANFYSYSLKSSSSCNATAPLPKGTTNQDANSVLITFPCLGDYSISVKACIDQECKDAGQETVLALSVEKINAPTGGLVPCGRAKDNSLTPWNETDPCQIKHIFLLIKILIDFALWRLAPIFAMLYVVVTGVLLYFSLGDTTTLARVKSIWKAFGIGVLIMLFAWIFLNIILGLLGFNITFYGKWFELHF